jgi:hypothetical protein
MQNDFSVVWKGVREFDRALSDIPKRVERASKIATLEAAVELAAVAKSDAPRGVTGHLAESIIPTVNLIGGNPVGKVGPTVAYGRRVELGYRGLTKKRVRSSEIFGPSGKGVGVGWAFGGQKRGAVRSKEIFGPSGKGVKVGMSSRGLQPTRPNPFLARALDESRLHLADVYRKAWAKAL